MLMIAILLLLLAVTSGLERNSNYTVNYVKLNRIVFIVFILGAYLAFNTLDIKVLSNGIGIYGGVFKITVLSQVFDIIMLIIGGIVSLLTCFIPYNFKIKDNKEVLSILEKVNSGSKNSYESSFTDNNSIFGYLIKFLPKIKLSTPYLSENKFDFSKLEVKEYNFLLLFTVFGGSLLISSQNLISLYLSLELQSFSLYILSTSQIGSFRGTSGGLKYFLLGGLSSGLIILGCSLLYAYSGTLNLEHIFMMYSDSFTNSFIDPCLIILFAGLLFKISAAPFHNWAPDVYSDVSTYSTTWLIIIAKLSVLILMFLLIHNIYAGINLNNLNIWDEYCSIYDINIKDINIENNVLRNNIISLGNPDLYKGIGSLYEKNNIQFLSSWVPSYSNLGLWTNILTLSALISLIVGTVLGISQSRIKRLFAYSTIAHVGFLLLGLSLNTVSSFDAFIFYLIQYSITNLNLFFILIAWGYLYYAYYLDNNNMYTYYLKSNLWKDNNIKPDNYRDLEILFNNYYEISLNKENVFNKYSRGDTNTINIIQKYLMTDRDNSFYDFSYENKEWLYTPIPFLTHFKGMHVRDPFLAFCLSVTIFSLAGVPPLIGFFAKQQILLASMQLDYYFISIIIIFTSVIGAAYYLRIIKFIYFYDDVYDNILYNKSKFIVYSDNEEYSSFLYPSNNISLIIALLSNVILFYILKPYLLINLIYMINIPMFQY